jgi:hypothetical protein
MIFMSRNKKKIPVPDPEKEEYECPAASWGDMTGLVPYTAGNSGENSSCGGKKE